MSSMPCGSPGFTSSSGAQPWHSLVFELPAEGGGAPAGAFTSIVAARRSVVAKCRSPETPPAAEISLAHATLSCRLRGGVSGNRMCGSCDRQVLCLLTAARHC